ncbi:MAG: hypothetical protein FWB83_04430 [Treponema sp.]|nr:hypothetical protein [Treponema sp.]
MEIDKVLDKAYEKKSFKEIADAPVDALQGISAEGAKMLKDVLKVKTVKDLAKCKYFRWAQAIATFAEYTSD